MGKGFLLDVDNAFQMDRKRPRVVRGKCIKCFRTLPHGGGINICNECATEVAAKKRRNLFVSFFYYVSVLVFVYFYFYHGLAVVYPHLNGLTDAYPYLNWLG